jgi:putative ABC transport system substrate-binding protein
MPHPLVRLLAIALAFAAQGANAATVAVIKSKESGQYGQTFDGFKARCKDAVKEFNLEVVGEGAIVGEVTAVAPTAIFAIGPAAARVARSSLASVPLVYSHVPNPESLGLKGANVTGVAMTVDPKKHLQLFRQLKGGIKRVGVIFNPQKSQEYVDVGMKSAAAQGIALVAKSAPSEQEVPTLLREMIDQIDGFWLIADSTIVSRNSYKFILQNTLEKRIPMLVFSNDLLKAGALMALSPDFGDVGDKAARIVERIVAGTKAENIAIGYPDGRLELNEQIAEKMGIKLPSELSERRGAIY